MRPFGDFQLSEAPIMPCKFCPSASFSTNHNRAQQSTWPLLEIFSKTIKGFAWQDLLVVSTQTSQTMIEPQNQQCLP